MGFFKKILGEDEYTEETEGAEEFYNGDSDSAGDFNAAVSGKPKAHFALVKPEGPENLFPIAAKLLFLSSSLSAMGKIFSPLQISCLKEKAWF